MPTFSKGPNSPNSVAEQGTGLSWTNPDNIKVSDDNRAVRLGLVSGGDPTKYLAATDLGFDIPTPNDGIIGIVVEIEGKYTDESIPSIYIYLTKDGTTNAHDNYYAFALPITEAYTARGSDADLWGTTWTTEEINAITFGCRFYASIPTE
jgi:hypothetical protein